MHHQINPHWCQNRSAYLWVDWHQCPPGETNGPGHFSSSLGANAAVEFPPRNGWGSTATDQRIYQIMVHPLKFRILCYVSLDRHSPLWPVTYCHPATTSDQDAKIVVSQGRWVRSQRVQVWPEMTAALFNNLSGSPFSTAVFAAISLKPTNSVLASFSCIQNCHWR